MLPSRNILPVLFCAGIVLFLSGCPKQFSVIAPPKPSVLNNSAYSSNQYKLDMASYLANLDGENDPDTAKHLRDRIVYGLMGEIDDSYGQFNKNLYAGKGTLGVAGDSTVLGLTAASTIATHVPTKTLLSALGTAFTGVNLSVDKNFFSQQTFQVIALAMQTRRDKARNAITDSLFDDDEDYSLAAAKRDLVMYFYSGTLPGGLQEIQEETGATAKDNSTTPKAAIH